MSVAITLHLKPPHLIDITDYSEIDTGENVMLRKAVLERFRRYNESMNEVFLDPLHHDPDLQSL